MANLNKTFLKGAMNKDNDEHLVPEGSYIDALNVDIIHSEGSNAGVVRNKKGNTKIGDLATIANKPVENARTIGAVISETDNLIYYLVASDLFDGIYEYSEITGNIRRILQSNKSTPTTPSKLNFNKDYYITGINYINGFLYWTDDFNPPRRINISRASSYFIDDYRIDDDISVILAPPLNAPLIDLEEDPEQENNIKEKFIQFSYRFLYVDNQYSAISPFSGVAFEPGRYVLDYGAGENRSMLNSKNKIKITFETGGLFVESIELLMRDTKNQNISIVESFDKEKLGISDNSTYEYEFSNNKTYRVLPNSQLTRLYDNVPLKAQAQEIIGRRLIYGNYEQGYDIADASGVGIGIDYQVSFISKETPVETPIQTFRSDRDYEIGIQYGDEYGRFTTVLTAPTIDSTVYIPSIKSATGNSILTEINNKPPSFASNYRLVIKQSKGKYYNIFPIVYYAEGMYRYFLVNDFDKDKIKVGEYIIFKSDLDGPTYKNKKYKVLEFTHKSRGFLNLNNTTELAGLYFKIKVEDSTEFNPDAIFNYSATAYGTNLISQWEVTQQYGTYAHRPLPIPPPPKVDKPIHYGYGPSDALILYTDDYYAGRDLRFTVEILINNKFRYTSDVTSSSGWTTLDIIPNTFTALNYQGSDVIYIEWKDLTWYEVGDRWKITGRYNNHLSRSIFGGIGIPGGNSSTYSDWGGSSILPNGDFFPTDSDGYIVDRPIEAGAVITIDIVNDSDNEADQVPPQQFPPSPRRYENIEEWFVESGAYQSFILMRRENGTDINIGAQAVTFRRGHKWYTDQGASCAGSHYFSFITDNTEYSSTIGGPLPSNQGAVFMIINGQGAAEEYSFFNWNGCGGRNPNVIQCSINIQQADNLALCETSPPDVDIDIYHETSRTYPIVNGVHKVLWDYQDFTFASGGLTNLGQLVPGSTPTGLTPHPFQVGDIVQITTTPTPFSVLQGAYEILEVPDKYNIIIDLVFPGSAPASPGSVGFYHDEAVETDQTDTGTPARIIINATSNTNSTFNAYAFGNGLESDRIRDNFNSTSIEYSPRASTTIEGYRKERKEASLTYSGTYQAETSVNGFNEFNYSLVNFKNLDVTFGSVQKIHSRDTDIVVFQEDKISKVLFGKNLWSDAVGGGTIGVTPEVLGTQISDKGEWGISFNPESFAQWGNEFYWTDSRRGVVLSMTSEGIATISSEGMSSYFRNLMKNNPDTQKIGMYNPNGNQYIIASNENPSKACKFDLSSYSGDYPGFIIDDTPSLPKFFVNSNTDWTAEVTYSSGSGWVTGVPSSGFGDTGITFQIANNGPRTNRTATITFTFCGENTITYTINQGIGRTITVNPWVLDSVNTNELGGIN